MGHAFMEEALINSISPSYLFGRHAGYLIREQSCLILVIFFSALAQTSFARASREGWDSPMRSITNEVKWWAQ